MLEVVAFLRGFLGVMVFFLWFYCFVVVLLLCCGMMCEVKRRVDFRGI